LWKKILASYGAEVYRGEGGDEFMIVAEKDFNLSRAIEEFTQAFRGVIRS